MTLDFERSRKGLNEEISEPRLIERKERQNNDILRLEDDKWPLWSKKKGKKLWSFEDNCTKLEGHFEMISKFRF